MKKVIKSLFPFLLSLLLWLPVKAELDCTVVIPEGTKCITSEEYKSNSNITSVFIPASVTEIGEAAFQNCTSLQGIRVARDNPVYCSDSYGVLFDKNMKKLIQAPGGLSGSYTVPDGVISIEPGAFERCFNLQEVTIPDSVTTIGHSAFYCCYSLTTVHMGCNVTHIDYSAFSSCKKLLNIALPQKLTFLGISAFSYCESLSSIDIPKNLSVIHNGTFSSCYSLERIALPEGLVEIGESTFMCCDKLSNIQLPDNLQVIGSEAFHACDSLSRIFIPKSVRSIGNDAFGQCGMLERIDVDTNNRHYRSDEQGVLYSKDKTLLLQAPGAIYGSYTIADTVNAIACNAFYSCKNLTSITMSDSVTKISSYAFGYCSSLTHVTLSGNLASFGNGVFEGCKSLVYHHYDGIQYLGNAQNPYLVLMNVVDNSASRLRIHSSTQWLHSNAFEGRNNLKSITVPDSVIAIGAECFQECTKLRTVALGNGVTTIGYGAFSNCASLMDINIPDTVALIGSSAFSHCSSLQEVALPDSITSIPFATFCGCSSLKKITLPNTINQISQATFTSCTELEEIIFPASIKELDSNMFYSCGKLKRIYFRGQVPTLGDEIFADLTATIYYPAGDHSWDNVIGESYGGNISWEPWHDYSVIVAETQPTCTTSGIITRKCSLCKKTDTRSQPAYRHSYIGRTCSVCGADAPWYLPIPTISLQYPSVSFGNTLNINVFFDISSMLAVRQLGLITCSSNTEQWRTDSTCVITNGYHVDPTTNYLWVSSQGIPAAQISDTLWLRVYALLIDGSYVCSSALPYSIGQYAKNMLEDGPATFKPLCVALLNYGAAAQLNCNYRTDALMNRDLTEQQQALATAYANVTTVKPTEISPDRTKNFPSTWDCEDFQFIYKTEEALTIQCQLRCTPDPTGDLQFYYWSQEIAMSNIPLTVQNASGVITMSPTSRDYRVSITGITAKDLAKPLYFCFQDSANGGELCSGILSVTTEDFHTYPPRPYLKDLTDAAAIYSVCADAYFS